LAQKAKESSLLNGFDIKSIPNPIDTRIFYPKEKSAVRHKLGLPIDKKLILFGSANIMDERKGVVYLLEALKKMDKELPDSKNEIEIIMFGKSDEVFLSKIPYKVNNLGLLHGESNIAEVYSAANVFVLPSLEDNLPNTIMESLACGTPVVAFNTGGIPEMIDHQLNGYLAEFKSVDDLLKGLEFVLKHENANFLPEKSFEKVKLCYNQNLVQNRYLDCYMDLA